MGSAYAAAADCAADNGIKYPAASGAAYTNPINVATAVERSQQQLLIATRHQLTSPVAAAAAVYVGQRPHQHSSAYNAVAATPDMGW